MTPQEHEKAVGVLQIVYGALHLLVLMFLALFFLMGSAADGGRGFGRLMETLALFTGVMWLLLGWVPIITGYGLLKGKAWARSTGFASCAATLLNFPFGTALASYTLWFLFGPGKRLGETRRLQAARAAAGLPQGYGWESRLTPEPARRKAAEAPRREEFVKPPEPYGWRGED